MDTKQAQQQIQDVFSGAFDRERYTTFLRNLLNKVEPRDGHYTGSFVPDAYRDHVHQYWRIGKYTDPNGDELDLLVVEVTSLSKLERARSALRNFAINRLKQFNKEASLIAFYAKDDRGADWRFSFVKIEHEAFKDDKGRVKLKQELTPAKRYSYLVGVHENSHTACKQLEAIYKMDYADPRIEEIEAAFSIEKVTDEFFEQYKALFQKLTEHLKQQPWFRRKEIDLPEQVVNRFAKKLLGQIVFLYFLQKKGWLGSPKDGRWGEGSKRFMADRFDQTIKEGGHYYTDFLQFLFYEALADERKGQQDPDYYQRFDCRLPFLNGGLFEADYDWRKETIAIPDSLFHNSERTRAGDIGTGILDVFNRYNFTIKEDEPLDKEVAVDPEMLGKVFENMLEVTERKGKGAFYTPREIVHYMCQESLIHFLEKEVGPETEAGIQKADLEWLIRTGHLALENDQRVLNAGHETAAYAFESPASIRHHAALLDAKLADIKVCDPAIGSGAFPVGMLQEIVHAREVVAVLQKHTARPYDLKKHAIANSIYGVDIDLSAIDIARLRLWLSLIVDEDDYSRPDALPNLDYKIMQGNSLVEEYEGVKLFDEAFIGEDEDVSVAQEKKRLSDRRSAIQREYMLGLQDGERFGARRAELDKELAVLNSDLKKVEAAEKKAVKQKNEKAAGLFELVSEARRKAKLLERRQEEFFDASTSDRKRSLRDEITRLEWELIEATLEEQGKTNALGKLATFKTSGEKPYFLWKLNFSEVFRQKGGFDVVIGNPPYFNIDTFGANSPMQDYLKRNYQVYMDKSDILFYFFERGVLLSAGIVAFITSNAYLSAQKAQNLRRFFIDNNIIRSVVNFENYMVFREASITTAITMLYHSSKSPRYLNLSGDKYHKDSLTAVLRNDSNFHESGSWSEDSFSFYQDDLGAIIGQIDRGKPLLSDLYHIGSGMQTGCNKVFIFKETPSGIPPRFIKSRITGENIERYTYSNPNERVLYVEDFDEFNDLDPGVQKYLLQHQHALKDRADKKRRKSAKWWNFTFSMHKEYYKFEKIWCSYRSSENKFCLDQTTEFIGLTNTTVIFNNNNELNFLYVLGLLNSECLNFRYSHIGKKTGSGLLEYFEHGISRIPIIVANESVQEVCATIVKWIIILKSSKERLVHTYFEQLIDGLVYELYFPEEIGAVGKEILPHLGDLTPINEEMSTEEKLSIIRRTFDRLYDPRHPVRNHLETLDSVPAVRAIRDALKR